MKIPGHNLWIVSKIITYCDEKPELFVSTQNNFEGFSGNWSSGMNRLFVVTLSARSHAFLGVWKIKPQILMALVI
jgi:hypothetical protein